MFAALVPVKNMIGSSVFPLIVINEASVETAKGLPTGVYPPSLITVEQICVKLFANNDVLTLLCIEKHIGKLIELVYGFILSYFLL